MNFTTLKNLYARNKLTKNGLRKAVADGLITAEQYAVIVGESY